MERQLVVGFVCLELKDGCLGTQYTTVLGESWLKPDFGFKIQGSGFKIQGSSLFQSPTLSYPLATPLLPPCYDFGESRANARFKIQDSCFKIQGPKGWFHDSGPKGLVSCFKIQDSSFRAQRAGFRIQDSGFKIQDSRFRIQGPKGWFQVSRFKFQDSRFKFQDSRFRFQVLQASDLTSLQRGDELGY